SGRARAQDAAGAVTIQPQLGPGYQVTLLGSAPAGTTGEASEAWGFRLFGAHDAPPLIDGAPLPFAPGANRQLVLERYTDGQGWRAVSTPVDATGAPYAGGLSSPAGRVTPRGGIAVLVDDPARSGQHHALLAADRGGPLKVIDDPGPDVLLPAAPGGAAAESLSTQILAAADDGDATAAYVAVEGRARENAVARYDGGTWTREPICVRDAADAAPAGCADDETLEGSAASLTAVAIAAAGTHAWLVARPAAGADARFALFERVTDGAGARWVLRDPGLPAGSTVLGSPFALTATSAGVWIDGHTDAQGNQVDLTAYFDGTTTTTWCDGGPCDHALGIHFADPARHRSFAWAGAGPGTRVIAPVTGRGADSDAYATLESDAFVTHEAFNVAGGGTAFGSPDEGWVGNSHVTRLPMPARRAAWPVPARQPLTAIVAAPNGQAADIGAAALAVGLDGAVLRYTPGQGWDSEQLLGAGGVAHDVLRGAAWPTPEFAYAVGDRGAMWRWDDATGLWEPDPGAPFDFQGNLMGIAFQPGNADRGYAVGRAGVLLKYDKSWQQEALPAEATTTGPLGGPDDLTSIAFAGAQAIVAAGHHLLVNDGAAWTVDPSAQALIDRYQATVYAVAGLPDGGAVAAGAGGFVIERDSAVAPWRLASQPLADQTATAAAAFREDGQLRALLSVTNAHWPRDEEVSLQPSDPGAPPPLIPAFTLPTTGALLRETATGWHDEDPSGLRSPTPDRARGSDPVLAMLVDGTGRGWLAGGWIGLAPTLTGAGTATGPGSGGDVDTAAVERYAISNPEHSPAQAQSAVPMSAGPARLLVGGNAACQDPCAGLDQLQLMPERTLAQATTQAAAMAADPDGPRALLYTGGRVAPGSTVGAEPQAEADRLAALLGGTGGALPVFAAVAPADAAGDTSAPFQRAFAGSPQPFGTGAAAAGTAPVVLGAAPAAGLARTHYAADVQTGGGTVRVVVIDNAAGSLADSDPLQNPAEPQAAWLVGVLEDARRHGTPAIVVGSRSLDPGDGSEAATDGGAVAALLRDHGASAYVYDSPERNRASTVPAGSGDGIPAFGSGTLGYRSTTTRPGFDVPGLLMLEIDRSKRDPATNRAPVTVRLIPTIEDLVLQAVDGRVLNRSRPALFRGLGRRPRSGDRWSTSASGSSPYAALPSVSCAASGCAGRIDPEVRFSSSNPDIADFVRQDPKSDNPRKPFIDPATDKVVPDAASGLLCAFNAGTTTVSVSAGGLTYATTLTVRGGSVLRPCGTTPLKNPPAVATAAASVPPPPAPAPTTQPQTAQPAPSPTPPPPPPLPPAPVAAPVAPVVHAAPAPPVFTPPAAAAPSVVASPPPPPGLSPRPIPPSGTSPVSSPTSVVQPAAKVEKEREEELAPEQQQSAVRYVSGSGNTVPPGPTLALVLATALAGAGIRHRLRRRDRGEELAMSFTRPPGRRL
ncbi:MAG TPA: hypothetical protein VNT03_07175, partial [Baekduia sp.]|nr:hypothetical protein [Baekduia sp.]